MSARTELDIENTVFRGSETLPRFFWQSQFVPRDDWSYQKSIVELETEG
jgi:hypothetical protein